MKKTNNHTEYLLFRNYVTKNEKLILSESIQLNELTGWLKERMNFISELASKLKVKLADLIKLFTNSKVYKFFSTIKWSFDKLFELAKTGMKYYRLLLDAISEFMSKNKIVKWTEAKLKLLDEFLSNNPKLKHIAGIGVAALLIYIWMNMSFTGDIEYDFDMSTIILALAGKFTLHTLFGGKEGIKLLMLFITGTIGLSFPWPGPQSIQFISGLVFALSNSIKSKIKGLKPIVHESLNLYDLLPLKYKNSK